MFAPILWHALAAAHGRQGLSPCNFIKQCRPKEGFYPCRFSFKAKNEISAWRESICEGWRCPCGTSAPQPKVLRSSPNFVGILGHHQGGVWVELQGPRVAYTSPPTTCSGSIEEFSTHQATRHLGCKDVAAAPHTPANEH